MNPDLSFLGPLLMCEGDSDRAACLGHDADSPAGQKYVDRRDLYAISLIVLSRWLFLQPKVISFLFLRLTLYLLQRPEPETWYEKRPVESAIIAIPLLLSFGESGRVVHPGPITVACSG